MLFRRLPGIRIYGDGRDGLLFERILIYCGLWSADEQLCEFAFRQFSRWCEVEGSPVWKIKAQLAFCMRTLFY